MKEREGGGESSPFLQKNNEYEMWTQHQSGVMAGVEDWPLFKEPQKMLTHASLEKEQSYEWDKIRASFSVWFRPRP